MSFREFDQSRDITTDLSPVNEVIPLTGTLFSGTDAYTKKYINITSGSAVSGGFWETVYDGAPTSVSSSALVDMTYGHSTGSLLAGYSETFLDTEKSRIYELMAQRVLGDKDNLFTFNDIIYHELFFFSFKRRIYKDEIKKGDTTFTFMTGSYTLISLSDTGAASAYEVGTAGDEAALYQSSTEIGRVYYNAGIVAIATGAFTVLDKNTQWSGSSNLDAVAVSGTIDNIIDGLRLHMCNTAVTFQNQTNLHSTIYFCRALNSDFNYSTNPSFLDSDGRILPTSGTDNNTRSYITTVGLYNINNELLAVGKLSEPIKKSPDTELIVRTRLSY